ncbi:FecCD family ABC transporter permease [Devosia sp.]|uniref:FecCD family ABC transporter permease n=1 Tax=Devosia sp. TaxID=1871048 RepID=UPI003BA900CB
MTALSSPDLDVNAPQAGDRSALARNALWVLGAVLLAAMALSLLTGASGASLERLFIGGSDDPLVARDRLVYFDIRLPRLLLGMLVGSALAVSGVVMQGLFRNPLADPGLVGVSSGAGLGAVLVIVLGGTVLAPAIAALGNYSLQIFAFLGGLATTILIYRLATRRGQTQVATMLLAGIAVAALLGAVIGVLIYIADDAQLRDVTFWSLGSLAGANWQKVLSSGPFIVLAIAGCFSLGAALNALTLGEATANHLGIPVERLKRLAIVCVAAATGASVAVSGGIGFVGIVVPHLLRLVIGPDHRYLLPASALLGAAFLVSADAVARLIVAPAELPIGIVTAIVGGPFFLWILLARRGGLAW